ncbi:MAG: SIR2 family protein, partial [Staphylococcus sp.]|nr:SIR2 family protein [Staphylococcus sp.]
MEEEKNISYFKGKIEEKVDVQHIRNKLSQFLQMDNLNFLIGAGCSSHMVEDNETGIPGMAKLYKDFFEEHSNFEIAGIEVKSKFNGNLESMLETMGGIAAAEKVKIIDENIGDKIKTIQKFIRDKIIYGLHGDEVLQLYRNFYIKTVFRGRKSPINIFTTNYDLYNEQALDLLSFPYNNGFVGTYKRSFNPASYKYAYVEDMNLSKHIWERVPNFYNLYKLHGSISWVK